MCKRGNRRSRHVTKTRGREYVNFYNHQCHITTDVRGSGEAAPFDITESVCEQTAMTEGEETVSVETAINEVVTSPTPTKRRYWKIVAITVGVGIGLLLLKKCKD